MIKTLLPNCRWLTLPSENLGRDWGERVQIIDDVLESLGLDLAEESVFILYDRSPGAVLAGEAQAQVARSVIGPRKQLEAHMKIVDWTQASTFRKVLQSTDWNDIHRECSLLWEELHRRGEEPKNGYLLLLKRRLRPQLELSVEALFMV